METWGFIWIMLILKIPVGLLLWLVWWAVRATPEYEDAPGGDGGSRTRPHPPTRPRRRPRGPHGEPAPLPGPPRVRTVAKARKTPERAG